MMQNKQLAVKSGFNKIKSDLAAEFKIEEDDLPYITDIKSVNQSGVPLYSHILLWVTLCFVVIAIIWANFAMLDEVTRGSGKTIPSSYIQVVQNLEGGILADILVKEGELVEKGQALLKLKEVRFSSSFNETKLKYYELLSKVARLTAEINKTELIVPEEVMEKTPNIANNSKQLLESRQHELNVNKRILEEQIRQKKQDLIEIKSRSNQLTRSYKLLKEELDISKPLVAEGAMSKVEILRLQRSVNDLKGELTSARLSMPRLESFIDEAKGKLAELEIRFRTKAIEELNQAKAELGRTTESVMALEDRVTRTRVLSPVKGTIKRLKVTTIGGVVQPGMDLVEIVPFEDQLLIEAEVRPADIAFLHPGLKAMVKLTAYDYSIYGGLEAELEHISADTITNKEDDKSYYLIRLRTNKNYLEKKGERLNIIAGMTADIDILTGKKSVLDYLLKPILKAKQRALKER